MSDVYAGDDGLAAGSIAGTRAGRYRFVIVADADPDVLLKIASQCLLSNTLPDRVTLTRPIPGMVRVEVDMDDIGAAIAESIRRKLCQLSGTESVELRFDRCAERGTR